MTERRKLVMATNNVGKLREARAIAGNKLEILSLDDIGYHHDIPETADTLAGNALLKVRAIKEVCDLDVFADDTGLLVDALGGAPGVYTARYAGPHCSPDDNIDLMLKNLEGIENRHARFCTSIALSLDGEEHLFEGAVEGTIAKERSGSHGFGYDPIFVPDETGVCFAEMTDEAKNAISHRGRAISAMMKWLGTLCLMIFGFLNLNAATTSGWTLYNTFDDAVESVFDTENKTYFLVRAQLYDPVMSDNEDKLCFLFCLDKETDEVRPYNSHNFLSYSLIRMAYYNAIKKYLLIVYDNMMIDFLYDNGDVVTLQALKDYGTAGSKEVRSISFDPENDMAYLATDFGFLAINDARHEVASSGIYNIRFDNVVRVGQYLLVISDGKLYRDDVSSKHISFDDFKETNWIGGGQARNLVALSPSKCLYSEMGSRYEEHYILSFEDNNPTPMSNYISSYQGATIVENKDGLLITRSSVIVGIDRTSGNKTSITRREEDDNIAVGTWDFKEFFYAKPREGFYSLSRSDSDEWTVTRQIFHPNSPTAFRSNFMSYDPNYGMMVNSHGIDQNFGSNGAMNPILLCALKDGVWTPLGIPYLNADEKLRIINPCGFAQDPDNPDLFYFGSVRNGIFRYNIKDYSDVLHITHSNDSPNLPGHVTMRQPYTFWGSAFAFYNPKFDNKGNLFIPHMNTDICINKKTYYTELWVWTPEKRKASVSSETFQPFKILKLDELTSSISMFVQPHQSSSASNLISVFSMDYDSPVIIYDHNGTPDDDSDDRQLAIKSFFDNDGNISFHYAFCAFEDPATGLVWVGTDNGVFTYNPAIQFSDTGNANRIKVSRNDGTSLADYLLNGISINNISIDNRGRKWFSLAGGGIVCTSSDGKTIIQEITTDNSMLPSDDVYATCYNPSNNSLMVATKAGLCEYSLSGDTSSSSGGSTARVYPNPVRPDYYGWVTIDGLEDDCMVKIADSAGNVIREIGPASGGKVQWDACNSSLDRVASGVYYVLASGNSDSSYSEVAKVLVVKN